MLSRLGLLLLAALVGALPGTRLAAAQPTPDRIEWPALRQEHRPWTRWWWMGSSVTPDGLTKAMEEYAAAGIGGLEITPIYGVSGYESRFVSYLSDDWTALLEHALREGQRLGLGIDLATGTGWPFGGPWVQAGDASKNVVYRTYTLRGGERLPEPVRFVQQPMVRAVGHHVYELYGIYRPGDEAPQGSQAAPPVRPGSEPVPIDRLVEPIGANADLQALALDQVRFPKPLPLQTLAAYAADGRVLDLTAQVDADGVLDWTAPPGDWTLYAVFQGWHGKMVERAAPGGEGYVIDHFSADAIRRYLERFDQAFAGRDLGAIRAFFNDSYEVDDASGQADWTPALFDAFRERRGYDLRAHLPALFGHDPSEHAARVRSDYRETVSDLLLETFTAEWDAWAERRGARTRNQAHGSPAHILDLYAASDIPETEGMDLLRARFAASAAHVAGRPLAAAEAATWLGEHFTSSLADVKTALDRYFLAGINHVVYHGTAYAPPGEPWPGWLFYAAVHLSPANPLWRHSPALNRYVARTQSFLQSGLPDNEVLLYLPIYDRFAAPGDELLEHFDSVYPAFEGTAFAPAAETMQARGYGFDYVSDRQIRRLTTSDGRLHTGGTSYRAVVIPQSTLIPLETFDALYRLAERGATVIVFRDLPADVPGLHDLDARRTTYRARADHLRLAASATAGVRAARIGDGAFLLGDDLDALLAHAAVPREAMVDAGLQFGRRRHTHGHTYFVVNTAAEPFDGWVPLGVQAPPSVGFAALFDPATDAFGRARVRQHPGGPPEVLLQLQPDASVVVQTYERGVDGPPFAYHDAAGAAHPLGGSWAVRFVDGGPTVPPGFETEQLDTWTHLAGPEGAAFAGTATYTLAFARPRGDADAWLLDLGTVHESASVRLNGQVLGTLFAPPFRLVVPPELLAEQNVVEVEVVNLMANRIADMDRRGVPWKKFYNVNFPARLRENRNAQGLFDAAHWPARPSGLLGPVTRTPLTRR